MKWNQSVCKNVLLYVTTAIFYFKSHLIKKHQQSSCLSFVIVVTVGYDFPKERNVNHDCLDGEDWKDGSFSWIRTLTRTHLDPEITPRYQRLGLIAYLILQEEDKKSDCGGYCALPLRKCIIRLLYLSIVTHLLWLWFMNSTNSSHLWASLRQERYSVTNDAHYFSTFLQSSIKIVLK